jgi:hypothetical protein
VSQKRERPTKCTCEVSSSCEYCIRKVLLLIINATRPPPPPEPHYHCPIVPYLAYAEPELDSMVRFTTTAPLTPGPGPEWSVIFENKTAEMVFRWAAEKFWIRYRDKIRVVFSVRRLTDDDVVVIDTDAGILFVKGLSDAEMPVPVPGPPKPHPDYARPYWPKGRYVEA